MDILETQIYKILGEEGFSRLAAAFYRQIPADDILGPMYRDRDLSAAEGRLREFLIQRFGGPERYSQQRGHPKLRMRHAPFKVDQAARDRWISLMEKAMAEAEIAAVTVGVLRPYFASTATFLINAAGAPAGT